ncbi:MAG: HAMP domain-containing histidine kinase [Holophagaceae bacterium]|nr:HAMP domain-containing histidine kinase [Holophagaceae bacterium]
MEPTRSLEPEPLEASFDDHGAGSAKRRRWYYGHRVFRGRLLGFAFIAILVVAHAKLHPDPSVPHGAVLAFPAVLLAYALAARAFLLASIETPRYAGAVLLVAMGDEVLRLAAVYLSGAESSWLFPLLVVGIATHAFESPRRALALLLGTAAAYFGMVMLAASSVGRPLPWTATVANEMVFLLGGGFLVSLGQVAQALRRKARRADGLNRALLDRLTRQNEVLASAKATAERASEFKSNFLAGVSHELRTPLTSSRLIAEALRAEAEAAGREDLAGMARSIQDSEARLLRMVNELLDLASIEAGRMDLHPEIFPTAALVEEVRMQIQPLAELRGDRIQVDVTASPPEIQTDLHRLRQVLINLLGNASKFTEGGVITLRVRSLEEQGREWVVFEVQDTGIGMSPDQLQRLFQAYTQAGPEIQRTYGGTGLGLSLSRELVGLLKGRIEVASEPGRGSTFTVILPRWFEEGAAGAEPTEG